MQNAIIELHGLTKRYGGYMAVDRLDLQVKKGEIFGILGPNGAGKSTTILMMLGLAEPTSGTAKVCGINATTSPVSVKAKVGYLPEDVGFYEDLTGIENLIYTARLNRLLEDEAWRRAEDLLGKVGLSTAMHKKVGKYSRGMRQRLGLADVLIKDPEVVILDEPTLGIDPTGVTEILELIASLNQEKKLTILLSSHDLHQVQKICHRVGLFVNGKLIACGTIEELSQQLFANDPYLIQAQVTPPFNNGTASELQRLQTVLFDLDGVLHVDIDNKNLSIGCSKDVTSEVAGIILHQGFRLDFLGKRKFGLNDIYQRYFETAISVNEK